MGWAGGCDVMNFIIYRVKKKFPHDDELRRDIYGIVIQALDGHDWDTHDECWGQDDKFDEALKDLHPGFRG